MAKENRRKRKALPKDGVKAVPFSSIEPEEIEWFLEPFIPFGMMTLLIGDPGLGKSLLTVRFAQMASEQGYSSILLSAEDHKAVTIRPRLEAAGADMDLVHTIEVRRNGMEDGLRLPGDGKALEKKVAETGARLLIVDPISAHLDGEINSWKDQHFRKALAPLYGLAQEENCAVVVVAHLNKGEGRDALQRTSGSMALPAAVRSGLLLARDPGDPEGELGSKRVLAHIKSNIAPLARSLECKIETVSIPDQEAQTAVISLGEESDFVSSDLLGEAQGGSPKLDAAIAFLKDTLSEGPVLAEEVKRRAKANGHSEAMLKKAKGKLKIKSDRQGGKGNKGKSGGGKGRWVWLPPK